MVSQVAYKTTTTIPQQEVTATKNVEEKPFLHLKKSGEIESDSFVKSGKKLDTKKKVAIGLGVTAGLAALATGIIFAVKKGKVKKLDTLRQERIANEWKRTGFEHLSNLWNTKAMDEEIKEVAQRTSKESVATKMDDLAAAFGVAKDEVEHVPQLIGWY